MLHNHSTGRTPVLAVAALALCAIALAACGGSSKPTSTTTANAGATTSTASGTGSTGTSTGTTGAGPGTSTTPGAKSGLGARFAALRECLKKNGVTLPQPKPGQRPGGGLLGGAGAGQGLKLPAGVSRAQLQAALKKCGGGFPRGRLPGAGGRFQTPAAKQALAKFASCMRENGVNVPEPNTSGKGPIFDTKGLNTRSASFRAAERKCRTDLAHAFFARPGAAGTAPRTG